MPTTGYNVGVDSNDVIMSYGPESAWGTKPAVKFQAVRATSEGFSETRQRSRPSEMNSSGQVSAAVTQKVEAKGDLKVALSTSTPIDLIAASIMGTPTGDKTGFAGATTVAAVSDGFTDSANGFTVGNKFAPGDWVHISGFTTTGLLANGYYQILTRADGKITTLPAPAATKTAGDPITVSGNRVRNSTDFQSFYFQKQLAAALFLQYPGTWPNGGDVSASMGGFTSGGLSFLAKNETSATVEAGTSAPTAAPDGEVFNTVSGFGSVYFGATAIASKVTKTDLKWNLGGSAAQYAMGSSDAQGIRKGLLEVSGTIEVYFSSFTEYTLAKAETSGMYALRFMDANGAAYIFTVCNAKLLNPQIIAGGPGQDVMASFTVEGNPSSSSGIFAGATFQIDKVS